MLNNYKIEFIECETTKKELNHFEFLGMITALTDLLQSQGYDYITYSQVDGEINCQDNQIDCEYNIFVEGVECILTSLYMDPASGSDLFGIVETETEYKQVRISLNNGSIFL